MGTVIIPDLSPLPKVVKTITYEKLLLDNGYGILYEKTNINSCELSNFDRVKDNSGNTHQLKASRLNIKKVLVDVDSNIKTLFIVGGDKKENIDLQKNPVFIDGYINQNFLLNDTGIGIIGGARSEKGYKTTKRINTPEYYDYSWGDYISHADYGVGIYRGLVTKKGKDYIKL